MAGRRLLMAATLVLVGCTGGPDDVVVERRDSAGVRIIVSTGVDRPLGWTLQQLAAILPDDDDGAGSINPIAGSIVADTMGRIYVPDRDGSRVLVFDTAGRFLRALGGPGGGPGEISTFLTVATQGDGTVGVYDYSRQGLVRFDTAGTVLPVQPIRTPSRDFFGGDVHLSDRGVLYHSMVSGPGPSGQRSSVLGMRKFEHDSVTVLGEHAVPVSGSMDLKSCGIRLGGLRVYFGPLVRSTAQDKRVAFALSADYDIRVYDWDRPLQRIRRDIPMRPATVALAHKDLEGGWWLRGTSQTQACDPVELIQQQGIAEFIPQTEKMAMAPGGELWVERGGLKREARAIDVFGADGVYVGTLPPGTPFPETFVAHDRFAAVVKDSLDLGSIVFYRVNRTR